MKVLGLDVSKSSVSCCILTHPVKDAREFYYECPFYQFNANKQGIEKMLALKPDIAVLEPTGVNYSRIWQQHLIHAGVEVRLIGHKELRYYRSRHLNLPDKDDDADALALACYCFEYFDIPTRFVGIRDFISTQLRDLILRLYHLNRVQSPIINRIRQDLAWQFPEVALTQSARKKNSTKVPLLWGWLAQERTSKKYDKLYHDSIGLGITDTVRFHAERLCHLQREEILIEQKIEALLAQEIFIPYRKVFAKFKFGLRTETLVLSHIYPFSRYLENGQPIIHIRKGRISGKETKRHLSERRFLKSLGLAPTQDSSGDVRKSKVAGGSELCRKAFWLWVFSTIEPARRRPDNEIGLFLGSYLDTQKADGKPVQLARSRTSAKAAKLLFKELVKEICNND